MTGFSGVLTLSITLTTKVSNNKSIYYEVFWTNYKDTLFIHLLISNSKDLLEIVTWYTVVKKSDKNSLALPGLHFRMKMENKISKQINSVLESNKFDGNK